MKQKPSTLPDFCSNRVVFFVVVIAQILATVLALAGTNSWVDFREDLAVNTLFVQWVALGITAVLCLLKKPLGRLNYTAELVSIFICAQIITLGCSFAAIRTAGSLDIAIEPDTATLLLRNLALSSIVSLAALRYMYVQQQWKHKVEAETQAQLQALQARIRPHFLFNSLNTIANLTTEDPEQAEEAVLDLADMFRAALKNRQTISLKEELDIARRYLRVEERRLGDKLAIEWDVDDNIPTGVQVPALLLQPLLENAVYHGVQQIPDGGTVSLKVNHSGKGVSFSIRNPVPDSTNAAAHGNQIGLDNSRQRIALSYGDPCSFSSGIEGGEFVVSFVLPLTS